MTVLALVYVLVALAWFAGAFVLRGHPVAVLCCLVGIAALALARREEMRRR